MSVSLTVNGTAYSFPSTSEENWGENVTNWASAITTGMLQKAGGSFTLTAEVDFGATYGLKSAYYKSRGTVATTGILRLANNEVISWRNQANGANVSLKVNTSDRLEVDGANVVTASSTDTLTGKTIDGGSNTLSNIAASSLASTTGSGAVVLASSPTLTTPNLGTPSAVTLTNATGLPIDAGTTGTLPVARGGTGVTSSTGSGDVVLSTSPTLTTPNLGTPSTATLTNATGLPIDGGTTGTLPVARGGTGVTSSTGSGSVVLSTSPTLTTPNLGTPSAATLTNATGLPLTTGVTGTLPIANGGTGQTSKTAAFDGLSPITTKGDLIGFDGTNNVRLAVGTNGRVLTADSTTSTGFAWKDPSGSQPGLVPVGGVVPVFSNITGAYSLPTSGTVSGEGWMRCDGAAIPGGQTLSGTTPDLTGGRFIYGTSGAGAGANVAAGATGGANSVTLTSANIPSLTSTGTVTSTGSTVANTSGNQSADHTHSFSGSTSANGAHSHGSTTVPVNGSGTSYGFSSFLTGNSVNANVAMTSSTSGASDHFHTFSGTTGTTSANHTHSIPSLTVNSGQTVSATYTNASPTAVSTVPSYVAAVYLIRVV